MRFLFYEISDQITFWRQMDNMCVMQCTFGQQHPFFEICRQSIIKIKCSWCTVWAKSVKQTVEQAWDRKMLNVNKTFSHCRRTRGRGVICPLAAAPDLLPLRQHKSFKLESKSEVSVVKLTRAYKRSNKLESRHLTYNFSPGCTADHWAARSSPN